MADQKKTADISALFAQTVETAKKTGNAGKSATSATARAILQRLREKGSQAVGLTVGGVKHSLQLGKTDQQVRKAIRAAQESAVEAGDLVFTRKVSESVNPRTGETITLNTEVWQYYVIPRDVAQQIAPETLESLKALAYDWVNGKDVAPSTRSKLAEIARNVA